MSLIGVFSAAECPPEATRTKVESIPSCPGSFPSGSEALFNVPVNASSVADPQQFLFLLKVASDFLIYKPTHRILCNVH